MSTDEVSASAPRERGRRHRRGRRDPRAAARRARGRHLSRRRLLRLGALGAVLVSLLAVTVPTTLGAWSAVLPQGPSTFTAAQWRPSPPTGVVATPADRRARVAWSASSVGAGSVQSYTVTSSPGGASCTATAPATTCDLTGLTNGLLYTVEVVATGTWATSSPSVPVTTRPYPDQILSAAAMRLWLDGSDLSSQRTDSGCTTAVTGSYQPVGCWLDKSGQGNHVTQPDPALRPVTLETYGVTLPTFDGTDDRLLRAESTLPSGTATSTVITVASYAPVNAAGDGRRDVFHQAPGAAPGGSRAVYAAASSIQPAASVGGPSEARDGTFEDTTGEISVAEFAAGAYSLRTAGRPAVARTQAFSTASAAFTVGGPDAWRGLIGEVIVLDRALTSAELRTVEEYLSRKWPQTHVVPSPPTAPVATAGDESASVGWTASTYDGAALTGYRVTAVPSDPSLPTRTCTRASITATGCELTGLTNGVTYAVSVVATNSAGDSPAAGPVAVTPYPASVMTASSLRLWLDGADRGTLTQDTACATPVTAPGQGIGCWRDKSGRGNHLLGGTAGTRPVTTSVGGRLLPTFDGNDDRLDRTAATLPTGTSASSIVTVATSTEADPASSPVQRDLFYQGPLATTQGRWIFQPDRRAVIAANTNGSAGLDDGVVSTGVPLVAESLFAGSTVRLRAAGRPERSITTSFSTTNGDVYVGEGWLGHLDEVIVLDRALSAEEGRRVAEYLARKWSGPITPRQPRDVVAEAGGTTAAVSWVAPGWDGGRPVTGYTATASPGGATCTTTGALTCTLGGLSAGTEYAVTVTAANSVGPGPASRPASTRTPSVPGAPSAVAASPAGQSATITWTAPADDGGRPVTGYTATAVPGDGSLPTRTCTAGTDPTCTVTGLTDGVTYTVSVTARNVVGTGPASGSVTTTPYPAALLGGNSLRLWLDGADRTTLTTDPGCGTPVSAAGQGVACWRDKSGRENHLDTTTAASTRPTTASVGGRLLPSFDGVDDVLWRTQASVPVGTTPSSAYTVATSTVANGTSAARGLLVMGAGSGGPGSARALYRAAGTGAPVGTNARGTGDLVDSSFVSGVAQLAVSVFDAAAYRLRVASRPEVAAGYAYDTATTGAGVTTVRLGGLGDLWLGTMSEVIVLDRRLGATDSRTLDAYLGRKWGVPITPDAPGAVTATGAATTSATVSWTPPAWDGGSAVTGYTATASPGGATCTTTGATSCTITGLVPETAYTVSVRATSTVGPGLVSASVPRS